jgi:Secretion system C-terminal sorting domain
MMARYTLLFLLSFYAQWVAAQLKVVGTYYEPGTDATSIIRWNADNGVVSDSMATHVHVVDPGTSIMDAYHDRYYFADPSAFHEVNFTTSSYTVLPGIQQAFNAEVSMATGKIYRVRQNNVYDEARQAATRRWEVVQSRFGTGQDSVMGTLAQCVSVYGDVSTFDSNHGIYYFMGIDSELGDCLYAVPTNAPSFVSNKLALGSSGLRFVGIEYDNEFDILYALNRVGEGAQRLWQVQQLNVNTGAVTLEADFPQFKDYQATTCSFDQVASALIFTMRDSTDKFGLYAYATVSNTLIPKFLPNGLTIHELECDNSVFATLRYGAVGARDQLPKAQISLYPDPVHDVLYIQGIETFKKILVVDSHGQSTGTALIANGSAIDVSMLPPGYYILRAKDHEGRWSQKRFVKW